MSKSVLDGMLIRTGVLISPDLGFILAGDPKKEERDIAHTILARWKSGKINVGAAKYSAHSCCGIANPQIGMIYIGSEGFYAVQTPSGVTGGNIFENSGPEPDKERFGGIRWISNIAGTAYATGHTGHVLRMDQFKSWARIDKGLPTTFDAEAIHGFGPDEIYAVGSHGSIWQFDGQRWRQRESPTDCYLTRVKCANNGEVFIAGHGGILLRGRNDSWEVIEQEATESDLWGLEWFGNELYLATMSNVYRLVDDDLDIVNIGGDPAVTCYHLSAADSVMWSIGEDDIFSYDGQSWIRIV